MPILDDLVFQPDPDALLRQVHVAPDSALGAEILDLLARAVPIARPKAIYAESFVQDRGADTVTINDVVFTSAVLRSNLAEVDRVFPYIATCGTELDEALGRQDDGFLEFCLDCIKEAALFAGVGALRAHLAEAYGLASSSTMNPGSGDVDVWPIEQQAPLFSLFGDVEALIGVRLTDTFLMCPNKSVSGLFFPTEVDFITCQLCHREPCPNRRAPFDEHLWREKQGAATEA